MDTTWIFDEYERRLLNLDLIDTSVTFKKIFAEHQKYKRLFLMNIRHDLSCKPPQMLTADNKMSKWPYFDNGNNEYKDFYTKYSDVKIDAIKIDKIYARIGDFLENFDHFTNHLFGICLLQMYPIYSLLEFKEQTKNETNRVLFSKQSVTTNLLIDDTDQHTIELPVSCFSIEELFLLNTIKKLDVGTVKMIGPLEIDWFWTLFFYSLYTNPLDDYAYKSFIIRWHEKKEVPMPDLCIVKQDKSTRYKLILFFYLYCRLYYNNDLKRTKNMQMIKACKQESIMNTTLEYIIETFNVRVLANNDAKKTNVRAIKILPCILVNEFTDEICLYYQCNFSEVDDLNKTQIIHLVIRYQEAKQVFYQDVKYEMTKTKILFKLTGDFIRRIVQNKIQLMTIQLKVSESHYRPITLYFGNKITKERLFNVDIASLTRVSPVADIIDEVDLQSRLENESKIYAILLPSKTCQIYFTTVKCKRNKISKINPLRPVDQSKLISIKVLKYEFQPKWYCHVRNLDLNACLLNFFNINDSFLTPIDSASHSQLHSHVQSSTDQTYSFKFDLNNRQDLLWLDDYKTELYDTRVVDLANNLNNTLQPYSYHVKQYHISNKPFEQSELKCKMYFLFLSLTGQSIVSLMPNELYKNWRTFALPNVHMDKLSEYMNNCDYYKYFVSNIRFVKRTDDIHNRNIKNWFAISCMQQLNIEYSLLIDDGRINFHQYHMKFLFNFNRKTNMLDGLEQINGTMKIFVISDFIGASKQRNKSGKNFLYVLDEVPMQSNKLIWSNNIIYTEHEKMFELIDKMKGTRADECIGIEDQDLKSACVKKNEQWKKFLYDSIHEQSEEFRSSLCFKLYAYFHLKDAKTGQDIAHLFFELNKYLTDRQYHNQSFYDHLDFKTIV